MDLAPRLAPLLTQFDFARGRLTDRLRGPASDSGTGTPLPVPGITQAEYLWEPVPNCWSIRRQADGPGASATVLVGAGEWGRDSAPHPHPTPPPFTTIAWRLAHLSEMFALRADYTIGGHSLTRDGYHFQGDVAAALRTFDDDASAWRDAIISADDERLDTVGYCTYPYGSDGEEPFIEVVWWVNQELLHHGAEIALLRDLYLAQQIGGEN